MTGLVGVISRNAAAPVPDSHFEGLIDAYNTARGPGMVDRIATEPWAKVAVIGDPERVRTERSDGSWAVAVGRPVAPGPLFELPIEDFEGQFALVSYNATSNELRIAADAFAMQTLFVAEHGNLICISTSALALARLLRCPPDRFALETFLRAGYHFGQRTNWEGISRLEPAELITVGSSGLSRRTYWRFAIDEDVRRMGLDAAVEHCTETAIAAYRQTISSERPPWIDLTGGFDSRLMALLLEAADIEFAANTRGETGGADRLIAAKIAGMKGWELYSPTLTADWAPEQLASLSHTVAWTDGNLQAFEPTWVLDVHRRLAERSPMLLSGGGGEHWRSFAWAQEFLRAGRSSSVNMDNWIDMRLLHPMPMDVFARDQTDEIRSDLRERMLAWAEPYAHDLNTVQLDVMYAYKMTGHFGAYRSADEAWLTAQLPFYLKPTFTAAVSVHHRHRISHRLMRAAIWRLDPKVARIESSNGGPAMPFRVAHAHRFASYYGRIGRRAATKLTQKTLGRALRPRRHGGWWAPAATRAGAIELLGKSTAERRRTMRSLPLYDERALDALLGERPASPAFNADLLGRIVAVELALRHADAAVES